jgi:phenylacetate 2-hydroxylase
MEDFTKPSSLEALFEFGRSNSVFSPGTIGFVVLLLVWALYVCSGSDLKGLENAWRTSLVFQHPLHKQATQTQVPPIKGVPSAPNTLPFVGNFMPLDGRRNKNDVVYSK